jgi:CDP-glucose 4,6-dehydratase
MVINDEFWKGKKVFITGHTGFKGSWLTIWLNELGVETFGFSIDKPSKRNLYDEAGVDLLTESTVGDIRDIDALKESLLKFKPDIVFHLAAQPLVRFSYENPVTTYETNVMGTLNLLEVSRQVESISAVINITTDKCYETDPMGGFDPYSNSKACSELISSSYYKSFYIKDNIGLATARSGNVLGGGDWAKDRLVPDLFRAYRKDENLFIRNPQSTRPWQHVLEPLSGYLLLAENLYKEPKKWSQGWNFGPHAEDAKEVGWIVNFISDKLNIQKKWELDKGVHPHEANFLHLDTEKAQNELGWKPKWNLVEALMKVIEWNLSWQNQSSAFDLCKEQINEYQEK